MVHRTPVPQADRCRVHGFVATTPARTLVNCAGIVGYEQLCDLVDGVLHRRLATVLGIEKAAARAGRGPGRKSLCRLAGALEVWVSGARPESPAEARVLRCLARWGLPAPERQ